MRKPELLVPASSLEVLKVAVIFGADAVYIGGEVFGLRAKAKNFSMEDMKEGVEFAHEHGVKVYVTANILAHNQDLEGVRAYFAELKEIGPDALIISDPGVYRIAMEVCPEIERHISTQANNTNYGTYQSGMNRGRARRDSAGAVAGGDQRDSGAYSGGDGDRDVLFMGRCVFRTREDVCCPIISREEMRTRGLVHIRAGGSMRSWKSPDRGSICRCMRMREGRISLTRKIFV